MNQKQLETALHIAQMNMLTIVSTVNRALVTERLQGINS
jgi:hypothetical protein